MFFYTYYELGYNVINIFTIITTTTDDDVIIIVVVGCGGDDGDDNDNDDMFMAVAMAMINYLYHLKCRLISK